MSIIHKIGGWIVSPRGYRFIISALVLFVFLLIFYLGALLLATASANLERLVLDEKPVLPVWPIDEMTNLVNALTRFLDGMAKWSGLFTLLAAIYAGRKALQVSRHRKQEAEATEFRDSMKWAAEHINLNATDPQEVIQSNWALSLVEKYVDNPPESLSDYDRLMAQQLLAEISESATIGQK